MTTLKGQAWPAPVHQAYVEYVDSWHWYINIPTGIFIDGEMYYQSIRIPHEPPHAELAIHAWLGGRL